MNESRVTQDEFVMEEPHAALERTYIEEYLRGKGHTLQSLHELPEEEAKLLMTEASVHASTKLAEMQTRSRLLEELHGTPQSYVNVEAV
jgi:hypothetical protein